MNKPLFCGVLAASLFAVSTLPPVLAQGETVVRAPVNVYDGKFRVQQGEKYKLRFFLRSEMVQTVPESSSGAEAGFKKAETVSIIKFNADYDIVSVDSFRNHQARITYGDFTIDIDTKADGQSPPATVKAAMKETTSEFLKAMKGASFLIKMSPTNKVISVYGLDALRVRLTKKLVNLPPETRRATEAMLSNFLSDQSAVNSFGNLSGQLPSQPIRVSESWKYSIPASSGALPIPAIEGVRTLVSLTNGVATLKDTGSFTLTTSASADSPAIDLAGTQTAITRITNATGMPLDSTSTQTMKGTIEVPMAPKNQPLEMSISAVNQARVVMEKK